MRDVIRMAAYKNTGPSLRQADRVYLRASPTRLKSFVYGKGRGEREREGG